MFLVVDASMIIDQVHFYPFFPPECKSVGTANLSVYIGFTASANTPASSQLHRIASNWRDGAKTEGGETLDQSQYNLLQMQCVPG